MMVWVFYPPDGYVEPKTVDDADGTCDPEDWASTHGVRNYPGAIYFFAGENLEPVDP